MIGGWAFQPGEWHGIRCGWCRAGDSDGLESPVKAAGHSPTNGEHPLLPGEVGMYDRPGAGLVAYGVALLAVVVSLLVRLLLWPVLGDAVPTMFFFPAIMIAAYYGGFGPGLLTSLLAALIAHYSYTELHHEAPHVQSAPTVALALFVLVGTIISGLSESLHRARRRIVADERRRAE